MFNSLLTNLQDEKSQGPIYTFPDHVGVNVKIRKGPYIPSTRHKISFVSKYSQMHSLEKKYKINPVILNMYFTENTKKTIHNTIYRDLHVFYEDKIIIYYKLFLAIRLLYLFITNFIYVKQYQIDRTVLALLTIICVHLVTNKKSTRGYMESKLRKAGIRDYTMVAKYKKMLTNFIEETNVSQAPCEYNFLEFYFQSISKSKIDPKKVYNCCKYLGRKIVKNNYFYFLPSKLAASAMLAENVKIKNILNITGYSESTISNVVNSLK